MPPAPTFAENAQWIAQGAGGLLIELVLNFSNLCLLGGLIALSVGTYKMSIEPNKTPNTDEYKNLNIAGLTFFGIFVISHFIEILKKRYTGK